MFTGIVEEVGTIRDAIDTGGDLRLTVHAGEVLSGLELGDSVAISGCCLTVTKKSQDSLTVELSKETLAKTAPRYQPGQRVNLERAMPAQGRFGGHMVSGHVEGTGTVLEVRAEAGAYVMRLRAAADMARYLIPKGSITVDGVSLTVVDVGGPGGTRADLAAEEFTLWLIPHTLKHTTLGELAAGDAVNLEPDLIAKYLERLSLMQRQHSPKEPPHVHT